MNDEQAKQIIKAHYVKMGKKNGQREKARWAAMGPEERAEAIRRNREAGKKGGRGKKKILDKAVQW